MARPLGVACSRMAAPISRDEAKLVEALHPGSEIITWKGKTEPRVPLIRRTSGGGDGTRNPRYSIFAKSERAGLNSGQRRAGVAYWNCLTPETGEFKLQQSKSREFGAAENALMRQALQYCTKDPKALMLFIVYDGQRAGRRMYYLFAARLVREEEGLFVGQIVRPVEEVPWVQRAAAGAKRKRDAPAAAPADAPKRPAPSRTKEV